MKEEVWKDVKDYEGLYQVSNLGRVKSLNYRGNGKEGILKGADNGHGYLRVGLYKEGKIKFYAIHKLVATAFLENPMGFTDVNHKDENKQNNRADNLEFCSRLYNNTYNGRAKKIGEKIRGRKQSEESIRKRAEKIRGRKQSEESIRKKSKPVFSVDKESGLIMWWQSAREAERCTGIPHGNIINCCKGKYHSAGNHIWFYADDDDNE